MVERIKQIYNKYYSDITKNVFYNICGCDPTSIFDNNKIIKIGKYVNWIVNLYRKELWKIGDEFETKNIIQRFHILKNQLPMDRRDINTYKSISELYKYLETIVPTKSKKEIKQGAEKIYEDDNWLIVVPHDEDSAILYGKNTKWCTSSEKSKNMFDFYNKYGNLYINIDKRNNKKYQFQFETCQFMDENDERVYIYDTEFDIPKSVIDVYKNLGYNIFFKCFIDGWTTIDGINYYCAYTENKYRLVKEIYNKEQEFRYVEEDLSKNYDDIIWCCKDYFRVKRKTEYNIFSIKQQKFLFSEWYCDIKRVFLNSDNRNEVYFLIYPGGSIDNMFLLNDTGSKKYLKNDVNNPSLRLIYYKNLNSN